MPMHNFLSLDEFKETGLLPFHHEFAELFFDPHSPKFWLFTSPVGTATGKMAAKFISLVLSNQENSRVLVLTPAMLLFHYQEQITEIEKGVQAIIVDRNKFLELESLSNHKENIWPDQSAVLMSIDLAKRQDIKALLVSTRWDLLVIAESHMLSGQRLDLYHSMVKANSMNKALLLTATPYTDTPLSEKIGVDPYIIRREDVTDWQDIPLFQCLKRKVYTIEHERSSEESLFYSRLVDVGNELSNAFVTGEFYKELLLRSASSSIYTAETVLSRFLEGWRPMRNKLAHGVAPVASDIDIMQTHLEALIAEVIDNPDSPNIPVKDTDSFLKIFSAVEDLVESLYDISEDSKIESLIKYLRKDSRYKTEHLCIWTSFVTTANYLCTSLDSLNVPIFLLSGVMSPKERVGIIDQFSRTPGILLATDIASEGIDFQFVEECINFDLPTNALQLEQRWGRFLRFNRHIPFQMSFFQDLNRSFEWEDHLLANLLDKILPI
jgi:superfamily II DNA or RNA helicase